MTKKEKIENLKKTDFEYFEQHFNSISEILDHLVDSPYSSKDIRNLIIQKFKLYEVPYKKFLIKTKGPIWNWSKYELIQLINRCDSPTDMLLVMNAEPIGSNFTTLKKRFEIEELDYEVFKEKKVFKNLSFYDFAENTIISTESLRSFLIENNLKKHECEFCKKQPIHLGLPFNMIVYHKDRNPRNNLIDNIGFTCPNCQGIKGIKQ